VRYNSQGRKCSLGQRLGWFVGAVLGVVFLAPAAHATTFQFGANPSDPGFFGNVRTFTMNNLTVTATAWGYTRDVPPGQDNALEKAALGQWYTGLGVCDQSEGQEWNCQIPAHQVDNLGPDNWVLFTFSENVNPTNIVIDPYGVWDRDVSYRVGNVTLPLDLTGKSYIPEGDLAALGFTDWVEQASTPSDQAINIALNVNRPVNALLFGAKSNNAPDQTVDGFKITSLSAIAVPEPKVLSLLGAGLLLLVSGVALRGRI